MSDNLHSQKKFSDNLQVNFFTSTPIYSTYTIASNGDNNNIDNNISYTTDLNNSPNINNPNMRPNNNNIENDNSPDLFLTQIPLGPPSLFQPRSQFSSQTHISPSQQSHQVPFSSHESQFQPRPVFSS